MNDIKYCKKCKQAFDVDTSQDDCREMKGGNLVEWENVGNVKQKSL